MTHKIIISLQNGTPLEGLSVSARFNNQTLGGGIFPAYKDVLEKKRHTIPLFPTQEGNQNLIEEASKVFNVKIEHSLGPKARIKPSIDITTCTELFEKLYQSVDDWLDVNYSKTWQNLIETIKTYLHPHIIALVIIEISHDISDYNLLLKLTWGSWKFLSGAPFRAEIAFSLFGSSYVAFSDIQLPQSKQSRILAVFGTEIIEGSIADTSLIISKISKFPGVEYCPEPDFEDFHKKLCDDQGWHMVIYIGHSSSDPSGKVGTIDLNKKEKVKITNFKEGLKKAKSNGLQIIIFLSCDGLGLVNIAAECGIPYIIAFKEKVPDHIATEFVNKFLDVFLKENKPLYISFREARLLLEQYNEKYPGIMFMPILFQRPDLDSPALKDLVSPSNPPLPEPPPPTGIEFLLQQFKQSVQNQNIPKKIELGEKILQLQPSNKYVIIETASAYHKQGLLKFKTNQNDDAISDFNRAIELNNKKAEYYYNRSQIYYKQSNWDKTIEDCNKALTLQPEGYTYLAQIGKACYQKGLVPYLKAIKCIKDFYGTDKAKLFYQKAADEYGKAIDYLTRSIKVQPTSQNHYHLGLCFLDQGFYLVCCSTYEITLYPNNEKHLINDNYNNALQNFKQAITLAQKAKAEYYWKAGLCSLRLEQFDDAIKYFFDANGIPSSEKPDDYKLLIAQCYLYKNDLVWANFWLRGNGQHKYNSHYYYLWSLYYYKTGDKLKAQNDINRAIKIDEYNRFYLELKQKISEMVYQY